MITPEPRNPKDIATAEDYDVGQWVWVRVQGTWRAGSVIGTGTSALLVRYELPGGGIDTDTVPADRVMPRELI